MRILRRHLRDISNPFDVPCSHFKQMYRLNKECTIHFIHRIEPYYYPSNSRIPLHILVLS